MIGASLPTIPERSVNGLYAYQRRPTWSDGAAPAERLLHVLPEPPFHDDRLYPSLSVPNITKLSAVN